MITPEKEASLTWAVIRALSLILPLLTLVFIAGKSYQRLDSLLDEFKELKITVNDLNRTVTNTFFMSENNNTRIQDIGKKVDEIGNTVEVNSKRIRTLEEKK